MINPIIALKRFMYLEHYNKEESIIKLKEYYQELLKRTIYLAQELKLTDPSSICSFYTYLYMKGYLSKEGNFAYNKDLDYPHMNRIAGSMVVSGLAKNTHISEFLRDLLVQLEIEAYTIPVSIDNEHSKITTLQTYKNLIHSNIISMKDPNGFYYYDPIIATFFVEKDGSHLVCATKHQNQQDEIVYHYLYQKWMEQSPHITMENYTSIIDKFNEAQEICTKEGERLRIFLRENGQLYYDMSIQIDKVKKKQLEFHVNRS